MKKKSMSKNKKKIKKKKSQKNQVLIFVKMTMLMIFFIFEIFLYKNYKNKKEIILERQNTFNREINNKFSSSIRKSDFYNDINYMSEYYARSESEENYNPTVIMSQNSAGGETLE